MFNVRSWELRQFKCWGETLMKETFTTIVKRSTSQLCSILHGQILCYRTVRQFSTYPTGRIIETGV